MNVCEGEVIFGKKHNDWSKQEQREFVSVMTEEDIRNPLCLSLYMANKDAASPALQKHLENVVAAKLGMVDAG